MNNIAALYSEFEKLAVVRLDIDRPPSALDVERAATALRRTIPVEFAQFLCHFYNRKPPFWDVLRIQPAGSVRVAEDIVEENINARMNYPNELNNCLLFRNCGTGSYDCFIYSAGGKLMGIGCWDPFDDDREVPPKILYDAWADWLSDEVQLLRSVWER